MPHFIIDCSNNILEQVDAHKLMSVVYDTAQSTGLFADNDVKVRLRPFEYYILGQGKANFIHIFGYIMEGRGTEQKANLSKLIISKLSELNIDTSFLSINIYDFEFATYCNKSLINPNNINRDRHFEL
jgi:5-carboxymethyl-2-hydroxymuconate isomerase